MNFGMVVGGAQEGPRRELRIGLDGVDDLVRRLPCVHALPHLLDDVPQIAAVSVSTSAHGVRPCTARPWPGNRNSASSAAIVSSASRPFLGVALHLLRVAAVRGLPDDEVAGEETAPPRAPTPRGASSVSPRAAV